MKGTRFQIVVDVNNTSAHSVKDNGKDDQPKMKCKLRTEVELVILKYCDTTNT